MDETILTQLQHHADRLQADLSLKPKEAISHANCPATLTDALERAVQAANALATIAHAETERNNP